MKKIKGRGVRLLTRDFTLLLAGQACSLAGNYALRLALSMHVLEMTGSAAVFGTMLALSMIPAVLFSPLGGVLADRADRRLLMAALDFCSGAAVLAALLLAGRSPGVAPVGALLVALSLLGSFESPTVSACVPQLHSGENILRGNAAVNQVNAVAALAAPFAGSALYAALGLRPVMLAAALCFLLTAVLELLIRLPRLPRAEDGVQGTLRTVRADLSAGLGFLRREREVTGLLLWAAALSVFALGAAAVGLPYLVRTVLALPAEHYGAAESAMGAASIAGSVAAGLLAGKLRTGRLQLIIVLAAISLLPAALAMPLEVAPALKYGALLFSFCLLQALCSLFSVLALSLIQQRTPGELMGKVMSLVYAVSMCAQPLGQLLYGAAFELLSPFAVLLPTSALMAALGSLTSPLFARLERLEG